MLARLVELKRAEADCLAAEGRSGYDALLDDYEPGMTAAELEGLFGRLRPGLAALRARIAEAGRPVAALAGRFPRERQLALSRRLGDVFGYDWQAGRLDLAVHPSSSGSGGDVRITTRVNEADPRECIYSTIHEVGHAVYEQGLDPAQALLPAGANASMGVHEIAVAAVREPARAQPGVLRLALAGDGARPSATSGWTGRRGSIGR